MTKATGVSGPSSGAMPAATEPSAGAFTVTMTASCGPIAAGSSLARGWTWMLPSGATTLRPLAWMARRCGPRAMTDTSAPPLASRAAIWPPMAPAP